jgi:hypothetical protein
MDAQMLVLCKFKTSFDGACSNFLELGSIITDRIIMILATAIISKMDYHTVRPCAQLASISESNSKLYPECVALSDGSDPQALAIVRANLQGNASEIGAALGMPFGMAVWLGLAIHAIGVEVYVSEIH